MEESGTTQPLRIYASGYTFVWYLVIQNIIPIAQLVVGAVYQYDCPRQPMIPVYLVVMGVAMVLLNVLQVLFYFIRFGMIFWIYCIICVLMLLFCFCWFITGSVWIYSIYVPSYNITALNYCNQTLYLFAFWTTTLSYILICVNCYYSSTWNITVRAGEYSEYL